MKKAAATPPNSIPTIPPELQYLESLIQYRLEQHFAPETPAVEPIMPTYDKWLLNITPLLEANKVFLKDNPFTKEQAVLLLIAISPHMAPDLFDRVIAGKVSGDFPQIGGVRGRNALGLNSRGFLPTGETALFLLAGADWSKRKEVHQLFWADRLFGIKKILWLEDLGQGEPIMSGRIIMSQDYIETLMYGKAVPPRFSMSFPAKQITTDLTWDDLIISDELRDQVNELKDWVKYNDDLLDKWGMKKRLLKGYRVLFYGPPGTGKTFTAGLLGKAVGKDVYKIDLSMVVSKYIGETEKNLELLFARAEDKGWILFFDEADALFGKRTDVRDAHDKYANQEVSYLLQRIEDYNGLIILATNMKNNMDDAFIRRFNAMLKFSLPTPEERSTIWSRAFPEKRKFWKKPVPAGLAASSPDEPEPADLPDIVKKYELSGGSIMNVVHYASLKGVERQTLQEQNGNGSSSQTTQKAISEPTELSIYLSDTLDGIRRELIKEGKPFPG